MPNAPGATQAVWYFSGAGGVKSGPVTAAQLQQLARQGMITNETLVWKEGLKEWVPATRIKGLEISDPELIVMPPLPSDRPRPLASNRPTSGEGSGIGTGGAILVTLGIFAVWMAGAVLVHPFVGLAIWIGTTIWAGVDASKIELSKYKVGGPTGPVVTVVGCLLLWIVVFPWYLVNKGKIARGEAKQKE